MMMRIIAMMMSLLSGTIAIKKHKPLKKSDRQRDTACRMASLKMEEFMYARA